MPYTKPSATDFNGYFCVPSGTTITVNMQDGYSLRFINLPEDSATPGVELPQTGGPGAKMLEAIGGITMALAFVVMVIRKRRMA